MEYMFYDSNIFSHLPNPNFNLGNWNTSNVTDIADNLKIVI